MPFFVNARSPVYENADGDLVKRIFNGDGGDTLYVGTSSDVSATNYESAVAAGGSVTIGQGRWLLSAGQSKVMSESFANWAPQVPEGVVYADRQTGPSTAAKLRQAFQTVVGKGGGSIAFGEGVYEVDLSDGQPLFDLGPNTHVAFVGLAAGNVTTPLGAGTTVIKRVAGSAPILRLTGSGTSGPSRAHHVARDIEFHGGDLAGDVVSISRGSELRWDNVRVGHGSDCGLRATQLWNSNFVGCFFGYAGATAGQPAVLIDGLADFPSNTVSFVGCEWEGNPGLDLKVTGNGAGQASKFITVSGGKFENTTKALPLVDLDYAAGVTFGNVVFLNSGAAPLVRQTGNAATGTNVLTGCSFNNGGGTLDSFVDVSAGSLVVTGNAFNGTPVTCYVKVGSPLTAYNVSAQGNVFSSQARSVFGGTTSMIDVVSRRAANNDLTRWSLVGAETQPRFTQRADGLMTFGSGSVAPDVNLYRFAADRLKSDDHGQFVLGVGTMEINSAGKTTAQIDALWASPPPDGTVVSDPSNGLVLVRQAGKWRPMSLGAVIA